MYFAALFLLKTWGFNAWYEPPGCDSHSEQTFLVTTRPIYTHSIPWAIHGKSTAKANLGHALYGNLIDACVRNSQDQQTLGIPIGPRSSDLIAETIGAALDRELQERLGSLRGTRYIDDFHLYFRFLKLRSDNLSLRVSSGK